MKSFLNTTLIVIIQLLFVLNGQAQNFLQPFDGFSRSKLAYFNLEDGSTVTGIIKDIDRKKGLIEEITLIDTVTNVKTVLKPTQIKDMYLPPSGFAKFNNAIEKINEAENWENDSRLEKEKIKEGYALFEKCEVMVGNKKTTMMMQLLNPSFSSKVRVYQDPFARETSGFAVGSIQLTGGDDKSFYISIKKDTAYRLYKKNYDEDLAKIYGDCPDFMKDKSKKWGDFETTLFKYSKDCK